MGADRAVSRRGLLAAGAIGVGGAVAGLGWRPAGGPARAGTGCQPGCAAPVTDWTALALPVLGDGDPAADPLVASRWLAILHRAMHDALNLAQPRHAPFHPAAAAPGADPAAAVAGAAHRVLAEAAPRAAEALDAWREMALAGTPAAGRVAGLELGRAVAEAALAGRAEDGAALTAPDFRPMQHAGAYRFTPGLDALHAPHWRSVRPFLLARVEPLRAAPPPSIEGSAYARALAEVRDRGGRLSALRSEEQTRAARAWAAPPAFAWLRIARAAAEARGLDPWEAARLLALVSAALADAAIAAWDSKRVHNAWRPVTAIRLAADDWNPATHPDPGWEPLLPTPPSQGHPSLHAAQAGAAATVLAGLLGAATPALLEAPGEPPRRFPSPTAAAAEAAESRIWAGAQFRFGVAEGLALGERAGRAALAARQAMRV